MVPDKQLLHTVPFQSTQYRKIELCVDNIKTIGDVYCPTCPKCVQPIKRLVSTTVEACCHVLNIPFKDQKPTIMLFGGFIVYTRCDYEKPSPFLKNFLRKSQRSTYEPEPKKVKKSPNME